MADSTGEESRFTGLLTGRAVRRLRTKHPTDLASVVLGLTTTRHYIYKLRPSKNVSNWPARSRGRIRPRLVSVSAECRLNGPPPLDRPRSTPATVVIKRAFHRHKAGGEQFRSVTVFQVPGAASLSLSAGKS